jgi:hypothetical protein
MQQPERQAARVELWLLQISSSIGPAFSPDLAQHMLLDWLPAFAIGEVLRGRRAAVGQLV